MSALSGAANGEKRAVAGVPAKDWRRWSGLPDKYGTRGAKAVNEASKGKIYTFRVGQSGRGRCNKACPTDPHICVLPKDHDGPHLGVPTTVLARRPQLEIASIVLRPEDQRAAASAKAPFDGHGGMGGES